MTDTKHHPIVLIDMEGFSRLPTHTHRREAIVRLEKIITDCSRRFVGFANPWKVMQRHGTGDGYYLPLSAFSAPVAMRFALDLEKALKLHNDTHKDYPLRLRVGLTFGDVETVAGDQLNSDAFIEAARLVDHAWLKSLLKKQSGKTLILVVSALFYDIWLNHPERMTEGLRIPEALPWTRVEFVIKDDKRLMGYVQSDLDVVRKEVQEAALPDLPSPPQPEPKVAQARAMPDLPPLSHTVPHIVPVQTLPDPPPFAQPESIRAPAHRKSPPNPSAVTTTPNTDRFHIGIITIKPEEFTAVLDKLNIDRDSKPFKNIYLWGDIETLHGVCRVAVTRALVPGNSHASQTANQMIQDLSPDFILVVGIAGGIPGEDFSLGDVIVSNHIHDLTLEDTGTNPENRRFNASGGPLHPAINQILQILHARIPFKPPWNTQNAIHCRRPEIKREFTTEDSDLNRTILSGLNTLSKRLHLRPIFKIESIAASDRLIKDPELLRSWRKIIRGIAAVEMESAGIYVVCHASHKPFLAIRGISDIVGLARNESWTIYACHTAASFTRSLIQSGVFCPDQSAPNTGLPLGSGTIHTNIPPDDSSTSRASSNPEEESRPQASSTTRPTEEVVYQRDTEELMDALKEKIAGLLNAKVIEMLDTIVAEKKNLRKEISFASRKRAQEWSDRLVEMNFMDGKELLKQSHEQLSASKEEESVRIIERISRLLIPWIFVVENANGEGVQLAWGRVSVLGSVLVLPVGNDSFAELIMAGLDRREVDWAVIDKYPRGKNARKISIPPEGGTTDTWKENVLADLLKEFRPPHTPKRMSDRKKRIAVNFEIEQEFKDSKPRIYFICDDRPENAVDARIYDEHIAWFAREFPSVAIVSLSTNEEVYLRDQKLFTEIRPLLVPGST
ncbi:5'-methylthioadenosine/S-adenosylhomocysteine nucleosidase [Candidatus Magnetaquicoccaceae bacterium FCR-1]|uniref:5'-methylthioadenosine/S-adenosylhomocysteine nucleosidase n=1 Tax=Candidatus Magnetaquiglobus chichijimensis TaxID=3141448 RepID=A0ABQ0CAM2_9PROT